MVCSSRCCLGRLSCFLIFVPVFTQGCAVVVARRLRGLCLTCAKIPTRGVARLPSSNSGHHCFQLTKIRALVKICKAYVSRGRTFLCVTTRFHEYNLPVPRVRVISRSGACCLRRSLKSALLFRTVRGKHTADIFSRSRGRLLQGAVHLLPTVRFTKTSKFSFSHYCPRPRFGRHSVL